MSLTQSDIDSLLTAAGDLSEEADLSSLEESPDRSAEIARAAAAASELRAKLPSELRRILSMGVPVIVKLAERDMPTSGVLEFTAGTILEFERAADAELDLLINNKAIGKGQAVKVGENFGLRITLIGDVKDTIHALGR